MQDGNVSLTWKSLIREPLQYHCRTRLFLRSPLLIYDRLFFHEKKLFTLADLGETPLVHPPPLRRTRIFSISWDFWGKFAKIVAWRPLVDLRHLRRINGPSAPGLSYPVADPGFPRWAGANPTTSYFGHFFLKTTWNWKTLDREGACVPRCSPPLDPPMLFRVCLDNEPSSMFLYGSEWCCVIGITSCGISEPWPRMVS